VHNFGDFDFGVRHELLVWNRPDVVLELLGVDERQFQVPANSIAPVSRQKLGETSDSHVAFPVAQTVHRVALWVCVAVPYTLNVTDKELFVRNFVCEMGERLRGVPLLFRDVAEVVVVFPVRTFYEALYTS